MKSNKAKNRAFVIANVVLALSALWVLLPMGAKQIMDVHLSYLEYDLQVERIELERSDIIRIQKERQNEVYKLANMGGPFQ